MLFQKKLNCRETDRRKPRRIENDLTVIALFEQRQVTIDILTGG
jgi:hypothetical protein